jgi:dTDP-L-rhamnose 4-epimerase
MKEVLITGGAGFIGSHVAEHLLRSGWRVRVLDCLDPQVHGPEGNALPPEILADVDFRQADLRDRQKVEAAVQGVDAVVHLAASVAMAPSMSEICRYTSMNASATAVLAEALVAHPVERLVVASTVSVYGEGMYRSADGESYDTVRRSQSSLDAQRWEPVTPEGEPLVAVPTPEHKPTDLTSIYALTKFHQEQQCLIVGRAFGMKATALRLFNVYGPRQSLSNPYTGVLSIFASRLLAGKPPVIYEDGHQCRDFVSVDDVAEAFRLTVENPQPDRIINIGSGERHSLLDAVKTLREALGVTDIPINISGKYRVGDIRHCFADISLARNLLGYRPQVSFSDGLRGYVAWLVESGARGEHDVIRAELAEQGLAP